MKEIDRVWGEADVKKQKDKEILTNDTLQRPEVHLVAERVAKETPTDRHEIDKSKDLESEVDKIVDLKFKEESDINKQSYKILFKSQPFTIHEDNWVGKEFYEATHLGGNSLLTYNMNHFSLKQFIK